MGTESVKRGAIRERGEVKSALLEILRQARGPVTARDAADLVAARLDLTDAERAIPRSSGKPTKWENEVQWAYQDLKREGLASALRAGLWVSCE
jgi:restriction endonuclease Mrr